MDRVGPIPSLFDDITSPPPPFSDFNGPLKHTETAIRNHKLTCGINIATYLHNKPNHTTNIVIATRMLIWELRGIYPIFTLVMVIDRYIERIGELLLI